MKRMISILGMTLLILVLSACACEHEWQNANCVNPQICALCGEAQGEALGHKWQDATCITPQICPVCNANQGEPIGHKWDKATCEKPQTCSKCQETQGDALGHTAGERELKQTDYLNATIVYVKKCTVCGGEAETIMEPIETLHNGDIFTISPRNFDLRLKHVYTDIDDDLTVRRGTNGDQVVCGYLRDGKQIGFIQFSNKDGNIKKSQLDDACFDGIMGIVSDDITNILISIIQACDPTQTLESARSIAFSLIINGEEEVNGIVYQCKKSSGGGGMVWADVKK